MNVAVPLARNVLAPLGITATALAIDARIQNKIHGSGTINKSLKLLKILIFY